ncbi:MAG: AzlC family ABC transporter permease [Desulfosarcinaceae bacterium]|nr:AzlC family ABC transporter permease [Desulfosarcinaceae bacterium]
MAASMMVAGRRERLRAGALATLPVAISVMAYGSVLGVLAAQKGITWQLLLAMNLSIFAGSAQFVMVEMWHPPLPILEVTLAVLAINLRYLLIGASLQPIFAGDSLLKRLGFIHLVADENWAITMAAHRRGAATPEYLLGGGLCLVTAWSAGTLGGHLLGGLIARPEALALDFAFLAVFTALAVSLWRGARDLPAWAVTIVLAVLTEQILPGKWYIVIGGVGGALVATCQSPTVAEAAAEEKAPCC